MIRRHLGFSALLASFQCQDGRPVKKAYSLGNLFYYTRELTNRRLLHDAAVRLRDMLTAHAFLSTCRRRAKVDDVGESDLPASWKQEDVRLVLKVFSRYLGYFCQII